MSVESEIVYHIIGVSGRKYAINKILQSANHMYIVILDSLDSNIEQDKPQKPKDNRADIKTVAKADTHLDKPVIAGRGGKVTRRRQAAKTHETVLGNESLDGKVKREKPLIIDKAKTVKNVEKNLKEPENDYGLKKRNQPAAPLVVLSPNVEDVDETNHSDTIDILHNEDNDNKTEKLTEINNDEEDSGAKGELVMIITDGILDIKSEIVDNVENIVVATPVERIDEQGEVEHTVTITPVQSQRKRKTNHIDNSSSTKTRKNPKVENKNEPVKRETRPRKCEFPCQHCGKVLKTYTGHSLHEVACRGDRPFVCDICGQGFSQKVVLRSHYNSHVEGKPLVCDECGKCFKTLKTLTEHKAVKHENKFNHQCDICNLSFIHKSKYTEHMCTHTGEKPWVCSVCKASFAQSSSLNKHKRTHGTDYEYVCRLCTDSGSLRKFRYCSTLRRHMRSCHPHHVAAYDAGLVKDLACITILSTSNAQIKQEQVAQ